MESVATEKIAALNNLPQVEGGKINSGMEREMKKVLLAVAVTGLTLGAANAFAAAPYVSFGGGVGFLADSDITGRGDVLTDSQLTFDTGYVVRGAIGVALSKSVRLEVEGFYNENDGDDANVHNIVAIESDSITYSAMGAMFNGYYDINFGSPFVPYLSAGIGFANLEIELLDKTRDEDALAYAFGVGATYAFNQSFALDMGYRYFATDDVDFGDVSVDYQDHQLLFGAKFSF
jgi:opacity protein-like surface antigen